MPSGQSGGHLTKTGVNLRSSSSGNDNEEIPALARKGTGKAKTYARWRNPQKTYTNYPYVPPPADDLGYH